MRFLAAILCLALAACSSPQPAAPKPAPDPTQEAWYAKSLRQLIESNRGAREALKQGKGETASALVTQGQGLSHELLAVRNPTLAAMEAASDNDQIYAEMMLASRHYGWARLIFQKNVVRWKNWKPQTPDTARRLKEAQDGVAAADKGME